MHLLSEGSRLRIYHLTAAGVRLQISLLVCLLARISPKKSLCFLLFLKCILLGQSCIHEVSIFIFSQESARCL